jgi:two-component system sensor histidine kinase YesM
MTLIMLVIIPVFIYMIYFVAHHITKPMGCMIHAAEVLEKGNIGMQIEGDCMPNTEFYVLQDSFNKMSSEIKYLFDYAYSEKLARKDAKIIALQSQINPHFLNNTLEMMNWQARMAGDVAVSKMIENLGTLLNYTLDRSNRKLIILSEELRCVDAYCYIISMRFGKRLRIEKEVDDELLQLKVPQLILQPLIENAVVHGVETVKSGIISIRVYKEGTNAILQIVNSGKNMTTEDLERVEQILNGTYEKKPEEKAAHESLGIHNVNERIKLIYGEEYGLTIRPVGEGETASTITIPMEYDGNAVDTDIPKLLWKKSE